MIFDYFFYIEPDITQRFVTRSVGSGDSLEVSLSRALSYEDYRVSSRVKPCAKVV